MNLNFDFFILLGDERELQYTLYIDCESASRAEVSAVFEEALRELSVEFDAKREATEAAVVAVRRTACHQTPHLPPPHTATTPTYMVLDAPECAQRPDIAVHPPR